MIGSMNAAAQADAGERRIVRVFLCGDVMTGRGIDQIMPHPCHPRLYEDFVQSAEDYVRLAEHVNGRISTPVAPSYIWGAALDELRRVRPDARVINLETSITRNETYIPKGINYRMSPENAECLLAAGIDCCVLGNNHILDWERAGLHETLATLERLRIKSVGAGCDRSQAAAPAIVPIGDKSRLVIYSFASTTSGVPLDWLATSQDAGVNLLTDLSDATTTSIAADILRLKQPGDLVIVSVHWGPNWGYEVPQEQRNFAHALIDKAKVSAIHGHSSHHPKAIEIYKGRLILYGCGDFLNDYEGISGFAEFRGDLVLMYFAGFDGLGGYLTDLELVPLQIQRFQLISPQDVDKVWLQHTLDRESGPFCVRIKLKDDGRLTASSPAGGL